MVQQITKGIKISVETVFEGALYKNYQMQYAFRYQVTIENKSKDMVQLLSRHWTILDALNNKDIVYGEGVVGKTPILSPGDSYTYTSGCLLLSPFGAMLGHYNMINLSSLKGFRVSIPSFKLSAPFALN
ncbi:MAG: Co2+/Mg2+ efflux protein ApaG [Xanthomarina sp.]